MGFRAGSRSSSTRSGVALPLAGHRCCSCKPFSDADCALFVPKLRRTLHRIAPHKCSGTWQYASLCRALDGVQAPNEPAHAEAAEREAAQLQAEQSSSATTAQALSALHLQRRRRGRPRSCGRSTARAARALPTSAAVSAPGRRPCGPAWKPPSSWPPPCERCGSCYLTWEHCGCTVALCVTL